MVRGRLYIIAFSRAAPNREGSPRLLLLCWALLLASASHRNRIQLRPRAHQPHSPSAKTRFALTMNNSQFRALISGSPNQQQQQQNGASTPRPSATPSALGTKKSSFVPMTPRAISGGAGVDFARQVRERNAALRPASTKKIKSSAPKGVKYGAGYTDRAKARAEAQDGGEAEDKAERVKALEEQMKLGQISQETFEALRDQITGGEASSTYLVKGLDRQLLERVRRGEDVMGTGQSKSVSEEPEADVDDELEKLGEKEVEVLNKEKTVKKGNLAPPPPVAGKKRTRDEIMADLKAQRQAAAAAKRAAEPQLGDRWTQVGDKKKPKIEIDGKGREVMITVDEHGKVKKRVRKQPQTQADQTMSTMDAPDASKTVLGADASISEPVEPQEPVPELERDDDDDIFEGAGTDYNPLGNMPDSDDDEDSDDSEEEPATSKRKASPTEQSKEPQESSADKPTTAPPPRRNYFNDVPSASEEKKADHLAGIQEVLKKAAKMDPPASDEQNEEQSREAREAQEERRKRHARMLANQDRDLDDVDMGFGGDRYDDEGEDEKVKLAEWKGGAAGEDGWEQDGGKVSGEKRKRKPKKRKGDASNMGDIMKVIEGRKGA